MSSTAVAFMLIPGTSNNAATASCRHMHTGLMTGLITLPMHEYTRDDTVAVKVEKKTGLTVCKPGEKCH
jgi:hypothetical protein